MRRFLLWMGIVALVLQASAGTAQAAERPFRVTTSSPVLFPDTFFPGTAVGTEIGQGSFNISPTGGSANLLTNPPWGPFVWCGTLSADIVLMASTGDKIFAEILALGCQDAMWAPFSGQGSGLFRIVGGTGRFTNATGSGFIAGTFEIPAQPEEGTMTLSFEGTISY